MSCKQEGWQCLSRFLVSHSHPGCCPPFPHQSMQLPTTTQFKPSSPCVQTPITFETGFPILFLVLPVYCFHCYLSETLINLHPYFKHLVLPTSSNIRQSPNFLAFIKALYRLTVVSLSNHFFLLLPNSTYKCTQVLCTCTHVRLYKYTFMHYSEYHGP